MFGTEIIIIDPENEYQAVCDVVGGEYISFGINSAARINPFDLNSISEPGENALSMKILSLHSLFKVIMGELSPSEAAHNPQVTFPAHPQIFERSFKVLHGSLGEGSRIASSEFPTA